MEGFYQMIEEIRDEQYNEPKESAASFTQTELEGAALRKERVRLFTEGSTFKITKRSDLVGIEGALTQIDEVVDALQNANVYEQYGARLEPGLLLSGVPGSGKTTSARYLASVSGAQFINVRDFPIRGSLPTANDIKELFSIARHAYTQKGKPIILFWDEFEGVAANRSNATAEIAAVVSQLTSELDGVSGKNTGLLLIGCTNYSHQIDHALKRSGRMGVEIEFGAPDTEGKAALLTHYLSGYTHGDIDVDSLALCFNPSSCAAAIEEACEHAWRYAVQRSINEGGEPQLTQIDVQHVFLERMIGPPANFTNMSSTEAHWIAVHELGHAIAALAVDIPVSLVTVRAGQHSLGKVICRPRRDHTETLLDNKRDIVYSLGGLAAGDFLRLPRTTGAESDLSSANDTALTLVESFGYAEELGFFNIEVIAAQRGQGRHPDIHPNNVGLADTAIKNLLQECYKDAIAALEQLGEDHVNELADWLVEQTTVTGDLLRQHIEAVTGSSVAVLTQYQTD